MLCVPIVGPDGSTVRQQIDLAQRLADLVELRLDLWDEVDLPFLKQIQQQFSVPLMFTLRKQSQGGKYRGSEQARCQLINDLIELQPAYLDLESEIEAGQITALIERARERSPQTKLILSYHNFSETPADLADLIQAMEQVPADYIKVATQAASSLDALRMLQCVRTAKGRLIGICMGEDGVTTRILGAVLGSPITYAVLDAAQTTAPGQLTLRELLETYRYKKLGAHTKIFALLGDPVDKSLSHRTHNAVMEQLQLPGVYIKFRVTPEQLEGFLQEARKLPIGGFSVTMPLKEVIIPLLDDLSPTAAVMGAVNTVVVKEGRIIGHNTDGYGALQTVLEAAGKQWHWHGKRVVVLGAGGAAKAIAYELVNHQAEVVILNRSADKALELAQELGCRGGALEQMGQEATHGYDCLIQCTSVGMAPRVDETVVAKEHLLPKSLVLDIVTRPKETRLLREAKERGCIPVPGIGMFINQAEMQFELWFEGASDPKRVKKIITDVING